MSAPKPPEIVTGLELHAALEEAGIIPPGCGDLIIEVPLTGVAVIHEVRWAPRKLLEVIRAHYNSPQQREAFEDITAKVFEDLTGKQWHERSRCPFDGETLIPYPNNPLLAADGVTWIPGKRCPKCLFHT